jgi:hypothetical protein
VRAWAELEAYLVRLVKKIGGTSYVLRDSGGRHLAPRTPPLGDRTATLDAGLRRYVAERLGKDPSLSDATLRVLQARAHASGGIALNARRFEQHAAVLERAVGVDFVKKGPGKRHLHRQPDLPFIAERFLSSYLLIIAFREAADVDAQGVVLALERARPTISDLLAGLPPDGGGHEAISNSMRWR